MKIISIDASNFLSFGEKKIEISNNSNNENQSGKPLLELNRNRVSVLVGPNGAGKTNIFRLLEFVRKVFIRSGALSEELKPFIRNGQNGFKIIVSFTLDEHERELLNTYLILVLLSEISQMQPTQKPSNQSSSNDIEQLEIDETDKEKLYKFLIEKGYELIGNEELETITFDINATKGGLLSTDIKIIYKFTIKNEKEDNQKDEKFYLYQKFDNYHLTTDPSGDNSEKGIELPKLIIHELKQNNYDHTKLRPLAEIIKGYNKIYLININNLAYSYTIQQIGSIITSIKNRIEEPLQLKLTAIYDKFKHSMLSLDPKFNSIIISLPIILSYLYASDIVTLANPREPLKDSFKFKVESQNVEVVPQLQKIDNQLHKIIKQMGSSNESIAAQSEEYPRPTIRAIEGEELTKRLFEISHSENVNEHSAWLKLQKSMCELLHMRPRFVLKNNTAKIIFEEFEDNCEKYEIEQVKKQVSLDFAPAGAIELLTVLASVAVASEKVLLLDEPAANLHPPFQRKLYDYIKNIAQTNNAQVIMITHSPYMINPLELENVWRVYLENGISKIVNVEEKLFGNGEGEQVKIEKFFIRETKLLESLFADAVILAEGEGEEAALEVWLGNSKKILGEGKYVVIFSVGSNESLKTYATMLKSLNVDCFIFCDEDTYKTKVKNVENKTEKNEENKKDILSELDEQGRVFWAGKHGKKQSQADNTQNEVIYHDIACYLYELYTDDYKEIQNNYKCNNRDWIYPCKCKNLNEGERVCKNPSVLLAVAKKHKNEPPKEVLKLIDAIVGSLRKQANQS